MGKFNIYFFSAKRRLFPFFLLSLHSESIKIAGLRIEDTDYTVKLVVGVKNGLTYYDHAITPIEKKKLLKSIDEIKRPFASKESSDDGEQVSDVLSHCKDKRLISILQGNS